MNIELVDYTKNPEKIIEKMARICYDSGEKTTDTSYVPMIRALIKRGHHSLLEHCKASFVIEGVTRNMTHQLVRHRHATFSQRSQRYCLETGERHYEIPEEVRANSQALEMFKGVVAEIQEAYGRLVEMGIKKEDARSLLPGAWHSTIGVTANFREWLHIIDLRVSAEAQAEIREAMIYVWKLLFYVSPAVFGIDYFQHYSKDIEFKLKIFESEVLG